MPAYDYRCQDCGVTFEITRRATDESAVACPACGGATKQLFHAVGVHFKGSGFYNTDSRPHASAESAPACPASSGGSCDGCPSAS